MKAFLLKILLVVAPFQISAEIERVTVKWLNPTICSDSCINDMAKQFGAIAGAAEVVLDQGAGQADVRWKPRAPFNFNPINTAMRLVGPSIHDVRVKVRGTISHASSTITLESLGDNTRFILLGPVNPSMKQYTVVHNTDNRSLSDETKAKFLEAEKNFEVVEVEGPLLDPWRYQVLYLVVEKAEAISLTGNAE